MTEDPSVAIRARQNDQRLGITLALFSLLPCLLGGGIAVWSRAVLFVVAGVLFLLRPPRRSLGIGWNACGLLLLVLGAVSFLPASWFPAMPWRAELERGGVILPITRSPQPLLSAEAFASLVLGWSWAMYLLARSWTVRSAHAAIRVFALGALGLAALALLVYMLGTNVPFWLPVENGAFGFFPNRNQTANVLALAGILISAIAFEEYRTSKIKALAWWASLGLISTALVLTNSRAGLLLFLGGVALLSVGVAGFFRMKGAFRGGIVALSILVIGFLAFGGKVLDRLAAEPAHARQEFRPIIHEDATNLTWQEPWLGFGLGNFEPIFRLHRHRSRLANYATHPDNDWAWQIRTIHPESDWLWASVEMGWFAPALIFLAAALWLRRCFPLSKGTRRMTRLAAALGGICFVVHGFQDVSGHRLGTAWSALFVMSTALSPQLPFSETRWMPVVFRALGVLFLVLGAWGFLSLAGVVELPSHERVWALRNRLDADAAAGDRGDRVEQAASAALGIAPLEWSLYYQRAVFRATSQATAAAIHDFRSSRALERARAEECLSEGSLWLSLRQWNYALEAWREALRRSPDGGASLYRTLLPRVAATPELRGPLVAWADRRPDLGLVVMELGSRGDFLLRLNGWLFEDPELARLTSKQRKTLLDLWAERGNLADLRQFLLKNPESRKDAWRGLAGGYARQRDFHAAVQCVLDFADLPGAPENDIPPDFKKLEAEFQAHPEAAAGLELLNAQIKEHRLDEARRTLDTLQKTGTPSRQFATASFRLHVESRDWEKAWQASLEVFSLP